MPKEVNLDKLSGALAEALLAFPPEQTKMSVRALRLKLRVLNLQIAVEKLLRQRARPGKQ